MTQEIPIKIKKYANRRLYNTATSSYVTLDDLSILIKQGKEFVVHDAKTNEDLTRQVLTQIIIEKETTGHSLLPVSFLKNIIRYYDNQLGGNLSKYLEASMNVFMQQQPTLTRPFKNMFPMMDMQKSKEFFDKMMGTYKETPKTTSDSDLDEIRAEMAKLQEKMDRLGKK